MELEKMISYYYNNPERSIRKSYSQLLLNQLDIGFTSVLRGGKDFHQITRDLVLSFNRIHDGQQTNVVFEYGSSPIRMELTDTELISYYADYVELRYVMRGVLYVQIEDQTIRFDEGDICFIHSMAYRRELLTSSDCLLININIDKNVFNEAFLNSIGLDALKKYLRTSIMKRSEQQRYLCFTPRSESYNRKVNEYLYTIINEIIKGRPGFQQISKGYLIRLMDHLTNHYEYHFDQQDNQMYTEKVFEAVNDYMTTHLDTVTMQDLIHNFHFQSNYFNNLIKKNTGMTYSHYLIFLRIQRAKQLLYSTDLSIEEIMWLVGYNNKGFFYKKFNELVGMSPKQYRSQS